MHTEQINYDTYGKTDQGEERFENWASCPGYVIRTNAAGFQWKQLCDCCPHPRVPYSPGGYKLKS